MDHSTTMVQSTLLARDIRRRQVYAALSVTFITLTSLLWAHVHGGVTTHHILHRADMPGISNWWGLLILPTLTWFLVGRTLHRAGTDRSAPRRAILNGIAACAYGAALSICFQLGFTDATAAIFFGAFAIGFVLPVFRAEIVLGFIFGMCIVFGAAIPTVFGSLIALVSWIVHRTLHPLAQRLWKRAAK
jgi:hypothetical protein